MEDAAGFDLSQSFSQGSNPEDGPARGVDVPDMNFLDWPLQESAAFDWDAISAELLGASSDPTYEQWSQWLVSDPSEQTEGLPLFPTQGDSTAPSPETQIHKADAPASIGQPPELYNPIPMRQGLTDVTQFLDGAYCPPHPCSYCRKHRLQCLIIRTAPANPNPITSCSSCVALFRECSLAIGEKRQPSGFETLAPAIGHLHGLRELSEDVAFADPMTILEQENELDASMLDHSRGKTEPKDSKQFVRKGARVLRAWFLQNQECPYPSEEQKSLLARETGFSKKRISTWFANARRRQKQKMEFSRRPQINRAGSPMPTSRMTAMTPLERWQASPPEDDPVPESAIRDAIASSTTESSWSGLHSKTNHLPTGSPSLNFDSASSSLFDSSISGLGSRQSEASSDSISTAWSHQSPNDSTLPLPIKPPRRHKRQTSHATAKYRYQCTFCPQCFKKKNDWTRHETSVHLSLESWICTPNLADLESTELNSIACNFCSLSWPSQAHREEHDFRTCAQKPIDQRSFTRKDHLWQHLRKFHSCTKTPIPDLDAWRLTRGDIRSRCGFCGLELSNWALRTNHIAAHFKEGARMEQWEGDWGLEAEISSVLRNAVLPGKRDQGI
ncbi:hypothetical protein BDV26DRAFT_262836 [Aspergillus bertholletiae]|uniref:Homeobox and C2H2 transcription factor n=1 Tax=Aspergillus bertholletiae TaxID=1226010 RepID=A0A5N7B7Y0_9EURO|nr:hypothetical protein BDV26DRAFT_262836 [Aspergillus bertholletiae]